MRKKLNTILFIAELVFIGVPLTALALFAAVLSVPGVPGVNTNDLPAKHLGVLMSFIGLYGGSIFRICDVRHSAADSACAYSSLRRR